MRQRLVTAYGAHVHTEMTLAVARARSGCALGVAVTAAAIAGSDGADGGSGHCSDEGWKGQGTTAKAVGGGRTGTQGMAGRGVM